MSHLATSMKLGFEMIMRTQGTAVLIHKNYGTANQTTREVRGLKNSEERRPEKVIFQFSEIEEIKRGDFLQVKGSRDLWQVTETEDEVDDGIVICFEARVEKVDGARSVHPRDVVINGHVYGGVQVGNQNSTQTVSVHLTQLNESVAKLKQLVSESGVSSLEKEDAILALERISQLAAKEKSPEVVAKAKEKLELVRSTIGAAVDLSKIAAPYIAMLGEHFAK
jgi:hypothetical protein